METPGLKLAMASKGMSDGLEAGPGKTLETWEGRLQTVIVGLERLSKLEVLA
jgi:hypothetical protein